MDKIRKRKIALIALAVLFVASIVFSCFAAKVEFHKGTIDYLTEKEEDVLKLVTTSAIVSTVISLLPDDSGTPIANQVSDLTKWFLVILAAVFLEKYLVTILFSVAFRWLIPIACIAFAAGLVLDREKLKSIAKRVIVASLALSLIIPASVGLSKKIEATFHLSDTIAEVSEIAGREDLDVSLGGDSGSAEDTAPETDGNPFRKFWDKLSGSVTQITEQVKESVNGLKDSIEGIPELIESSFSRLIESIAIMLVTSCLIPVLVVLFFVWAIKALLSLAA